MRLISRISGIKTTWLIGIAYMMLSLNSCNRGTLINESFDVPQPAWNYNDPICFDLWVKDTSFRYDVTLNLKHSNDFEWQNAFFLVTTVFPDMSTTIDTLECLLADQSGRWIGNRSGKYYRIGFLYKKGIRFPAPGEYRLEVRHAMRDDDLENIYSIGMKIHPTS